MALAPLTVAAEDITLAVASNFATPLQEILRRFPMAQEAEIRLALGSSGKLYAQIRHGAPFHVFLSADQAKPRALEADGAGVSGSRFTYALGTLALWTAAAENVDPLALLRAGQFRHLALANPRLAPYGLAAQQTLQSLGLLTATRPRWVQGESAAQALQFTASGNAELGFVALSQLRDAELGGRRWIVPGELHAPIRQDAVLLAAGESSAMARALLDYLQGPQAAQIMAAYGYQAVAR